MSVEQGTAFPRSTVEKTYRLDIKQFTRDVQFDLGGHLVCTWTAGGEKIASIRMNLVEDGLWFDYRQTDQQGNQEDVSYMVGLKTTACNFGGSRYWFVCPECNGGCRILYLPYTGGTFACRKCHNLIYPSQLERRCVIDRAFEAMVKLPEVQRQHDAARSVKKQKKLAQKREQMTADLKSFVGEYGQK